MIRSATTVQLLAKSELILLSIDDCLFLAPHRQELEELLPKIEEFLALRLKLALHPDKVSIRPLNHGIDFLGIVVHPFHRTLRTTTKRRMLRKLTERHGEAFRGEIDSDSLHQSLQSYLGILSHVDEHELSTLLKNGFFLFSPYRGGIVSRKQWIRGDMIWLAVV